MTDIPSTAPRSFTDVFVRSFHNPTKKRLEVRDTYITGLVLRVTVKQVKSFTLQTRGPDGATLQITIGRYPAISVRDARDIAKSHLVLIARGEDPREFARQAKALRDANCLTLRALLDEVEIVFAPSKAMWRKGHRLGRGKPEARAAIENVFAPLLTHPVNKVTTLQVSKTVRSYSPLKPKDGKETANGAAARALAYLRPVFDWASGRGRFKKEGAARKVLLDLPDLSSVHDPSIDDPTITGERDRLLTQDELAAVLPLLVYPAPEGLREHIDAENDYGPIAFLFLLLTLSRVEEVEGARKKDFDLCSGNWTKTVKTRRKPGTVGSTARRKVVVPLSDEVIALLWSLPSFNNGHPDDLVFPSSAGGRLGNWDRTQRAINKLSHTSGWHRHDLRRTAATILRQLGAAPSDIDTLLCHVNPLNAEKVSGAATNYIFDTKVLLDVVDNERVAVNLLARALTSICVRSSSVSGSRSELKGAVLSPVISAPSPWSRAV